MMSGNAPGGINAFYRGESPSPHAAARTLKEIYKLCKTNEEESEEEDSESLERANELFM